jgi:hypothetical protein
MSSVILDYSHDCLLYVANRRLSTLVEFALQVGAERPSGSEFVAKLQQFWDEAFPGINFDLKERFPTLEEQKFWATCFFDLGQRIFLRQIGNQDADTWQASAITDAHTIARELFSQVQAADPDWWPRSLPPPEAGKNSSPP